MSVVIAVEKWDDGRINRLTIKQDAWRPPLIVQYLYDENKLLRGLEFSGAIPSLPDLLSFVNERFIDRIGIIEDIELIKEVRLIQDKATINAEDIDIVASDSAVPTATETVILTYTVPANKVLFIYDWSCMLYDADGQIGGLMYISGVTPIRTISVGAGQKGFQTPLTKPKRLTAGQTLEIAVRHDMGVDQWCYAHAGGILLES